MWEDEGVKTIPALIRVRPPLRAGRWVAMNGLSNVSSHRRTIVTVNGRARRKMGPGDFFGEISLLDNGPRSATVTAQTPIQLLGLTQWNFKRLVESNPGIATKMLKTMAGRLRAARGQPLV